MPTSGNGRERDVVAVEHALQVDHGVLPVFQLGLVGRDAEAGAAGHFFGFALVGDEVGRQVPEFHRRLEQHGGQEQVAGADLLGDDGLGGLVEARVVTLHHGHADGHVAAFVAADVLEAFLEDGLAGVVVHLLEDGGGSDLAHQEGAEQHGQVVFGHRPACSRSSSGRR